MRAAENILRQEGRSISYDLSKLFLASFLYKLVYLLFTGILHFMDEKAKGPRRAGLRFLLKFIWVHP